MLSALTNRKAPVCMTFIMVLFAAALMFETDVKAAAGAPLVCAPSTTCTVGEYVYDDSYTLVVDAACTITSYTPDNVLYQDGVALSTTNGWYYKTFTAPETTGLYRAEVCCLVDGEKMCLDKSFEVKANASGSSVSAADIAEAVWGYSGRTLTSFGTLVADIWAASSRTLSSFGNLAADVWNNSTRTITGGTATTSTSTTTTITTINNQVTETRNLIEQLVNKPIIENSLQNDTQDLSLKLDETRAVASQLYINTQYLVSGSETISAKWMKFSEEELMIQVNDLLVVLGTDNETAGTSLIGQTNWLTNAWNFEAAVKIKDQTKSLQTSLTAIARSLDIYGVKRLPTHDLRNLTASTKKLETLVGSSMDPSDKLTLFGKIKETTELASAFDAKSVEVKNVLANWKKLETNDKLAKASAINKSIATINLLPQMGQVLSASTAHDITDKDLKNQFLSFLGVLATNKLSLAQPDGAALANTWLEEGSVVFKTMITNPSSLISQTVPLKYYLPAEVKAESVIEKSEGVEVVFDSEKNQYYVSGEFRLAPLQTKTISVRVNDIWQISEEEIASVRSQAEALAKPLEKTAYFAQGVTLKSDVDVSLDKVASLTAGAVTPEEKIRAYREAKIEFDGALAKTDKLKELASEAGSSSNLFGFVGGAQTMAVWGMMIVIVAGFIWLSLSMRAISRPVPNQAETPKSTKKHHRWFPFLSSLIVVAGLSAMTTRQVMVMNQPRLTPTETVLGTEVQESEPTPTPIPNSGGQDLVMVIVPSEGRINVRANPSFTASIVARFDTTSEVVRLEEKEGWVRITEGWVNKDNIFDRNSQPSEEKTVTVVVGETPTGWLRVRTAPSGREIGTVDSGTKLPMVSQAEGWFEVKLTSGEVGWISSVYASIE